MAIKNRRGTYTNFDPSKMVAGELAVVLSGDTTTSTGKGIYICFSPGDVQRLSTYEEVSAEIAKAMSESEVVQEIIERYLDEHGISIPDGSITSAKIANGAVTSAKLDTTFNNSLQKTSNLVTSVSSSSTNTQYPSAKCLYDMVGNIETLLVAI